MGQPSSSSGLPSGHIDGTLFTLAWMQNVELRRRIQIELNKDEAKNALAAPSTAANSSSSAISVKISGNTII
jgi:hypothetical protein